LERAKILSNKSIIVLHVLSRWFPNREFSSSDNKFYKNTHKPINQNENFVIKRLDYASNRLIFDYNRWLEHHYVQPLMQTAWMQVLFKKNYIEYSQPALQWLTFVSKDFAIITNLPL
jgi:hypothetical protein